MAPTAQTPDLRAVLHRHLRDPTSSFSIGSYGAIAEFHRDTDEALAGDGEAELAAATARGALRIDRTEGVVPLAYETLSRRAGRWQQGVVFCLPEAVARGAARKTLTELGPDAAAIQGRDRDALLFDLGLAARNVDFCVRTADAALIDVLRAHAGRSVLEPGSPAMAAILAADPHRVVVSAMGRAEVYQPIGRDRTPEGPHTHVLPKMLRGGRTHAATIPVPAGTLPCLSLYPANPRLTALGERKPFDAGQHRAFQALLAAWGAPLYVREKARVERAVRGGEAPAGFVPHESRLGRRALRVLVRQLRFTAAAEDPVAASWIDRFDGPARARRRS